jgi:glycosyltransferase involved in cell wall biosynthesis
MMLTENWKGFFNFVRIISDLKKIFVISHACFTAINRNVYHLFVQGGWDLEIVAPEELIFPSGKKKADPPGKGDPEMHYLKLKGTNPRSYQFEGLIELLNSKRPDILVLDNDPVSMLSNVLGNWSRQNQAWLFCISNENLPLGIKSSVSRRGIKALPVILFKRALLNRNKQLVNGIFAINTDGERIFRKEGYQNVRHMPLGFDPSFFYPDADARNRIREKYKITNTVIAYFGRLTKEKGAHLLIQALRELKSLDWRLMMDSFDIYASEYNQEINRLLLEAGIMNRVLFVKPDHFEIATYMNAADIVVVPSIATANWKEQYGRVAAEAMACGKEVIASDSGALPELLGGHGFLFKEGNVKELRRLLESILLLDPEIKKDTEKIAAYALANLSIQKQKAVMETAFL